MKQIILKKMILQMLMKMMMIYKNNLLLMILFWVYFEGKVPNKRAKSALGGTHTRWVGLPIRGS